MSAPLEVVSVIRAAVAENLARQERLAEQGGSRRLTIDDQRALARTIINRELDAIAQRNLARGSQLFDDETEEAVAQAVLDKIFGLGKLQRLLEDESIANIIANGYDQVFIEYGDGRKEAGPPIAENDDELIETIREIGRRQGLTEREFNPSHPSLNLQLSDGSRLFAVAWVCERPCVAIRRHRFLKVTLDTLLQLGSIDRGLRAFLSAAVRSKQTILVAGPTNSGKTTLLRALSNEIPAKDRLVTVETEFELGLDKFPDLHPDVVAFEAREANVEGVGAVSPSDLVRMSLRMSPDRVIVGEVRGNEVIPMLNAMSQGNDGSMCTIHSDSSGSVFQKIAIYALQSPERLSFEASMMLAANAIDLVIFAGRGPRGRTIQSIRQVAGFDGAGVQTNEIFWPNHESRAVPGDPIPAAFLEELVAVGYDPVWHQNREGWWS
jgi:Flp pilus assembly CpaF family ATPase